jgi:hypothetical protein
MKTRLMILPLLIAFAFTVCLPQAVASFQARDHLTPQEVELVKDTQILDKRIDVFIKAADRRLQALTGTGGTNAKQLKKDSEAWGNLPAGTPAELMSDIARIFDEAITNIDDVSSRDEKNPLIGKSLRKLAAAATRIVEQLKPFATASKGDSEASSYDQLIENAESIVQAASKLPPEVAKKGKSKVEKSKDSN